jgi:xanthine dehydrogenase molybdopterin-binding subunit B
LRCRGLIPLSISGEAQYVNEIPTLPGEVYAAFTLTTVGQGYIANIDPSEILVRNSDDSDSKEML